MFDLTPKIKQTFNFYCELRIRSHGLLCSCLGHNQHETKNCFIHPTHFAVTALYLHYLQNVHTQAHEVSSQHSLAPSKNCDRLVGMLTSELLILPPCVQQYHVFFSFLPFSISTLPILITPSGGIQSYGTNNIPARPVLLFFRPKHLYIQADIGALVTPPPHLPPPLLPLRTRR